MKKWIQVTLTILGVIMFFVFCGMIGFDGEQTGRAFAMLLPAVIGYFLGLDWLKKYKEKKRLEEQNKSHKQTQFQ